MTELIFSSLNDCYKDFVFFISFAFSTWIVQVQLTSSSTSLFTLPSFSRAFLIGQGAVSMNLSRSLSHLDFCEADQPEHATGVLS